MAGNLYVVKEINKNNLSIHYVKLPSDHKGCGDLGVCVLRGIFGCDVLYTDRLVEIVSTQEANL